MVSRSSADSESQVVDESNTRRYRSAWTTDRLRPLFNYGNSATLTHTTTHELRLSSDCGHVEGWHRLPNTLARCGGRLPLYQLRERIAADYVLSHIWRSRRAAISNTGPFRYPKDGERRGGNEWKFFRIQARLLPQARCVVSDDDDGSSWLHGTVAERRSLVGELSLSCARPVADE